MYVHARWYKNLSKSICNSCNETVEVNAAFIKLDIQATLTSPVVSMGNSMHSGKPLRIM